MLLPDDVASTLLPSIICLLTTVPVFTTIQEYEWVDRWVQAESAKASATSVVLAAAQRYGGDDVDSDSDEDDDGADSGDPSDGRMPKRSAQRDPLTTFPLPGGRTRRLKRILAADGQTRVVSFNRSPLWVDRTWTSSSGVETIRITVWRRGSEQLMSAVLSAAHALHTETLESDGTSFLTVFEARVPQPGDGAPPHRRRRLRGHSSAADGGGPADGPELRGPELEWQGVAPVPHAVYLRQLVFPPDHFKEVNRMISDMRDFQDLRLWCAHCRSGGAFWPLRGTPPAAAERSDFVSSAPPAAAPAPIVRAGTRSAGSPTTEATSSRAHPAAARP